MVKYDEYFIKLPNNLIWTNNKDEISLTNAIGSKAIIVLSNLAFRCNPLGVCYFTLEDLITDLGYKPKTGKGKINEKIKNTLIELEKANFIIESNISMEDIKINSFVKCKINNNIPLNEEGKESNFFSLYYSSYRKMIDLDLGNDKDILINSYCYICARIWHRPKNNRSMNEYGMRNEGRAETTYFTYEDAARDLKISETTYKENVDILADNKLIAYDNIGLVKKGDKTRVAGNVYVIDLEELQPALDGSVCHYKNEGYEILGKKTDEVTKQIIGLSSRINQLNEQGHDTSKLDKKLERLEKQKEKKPKKIDMEKLRNETREIATSNLEITKPYIENWNKKYNTTALLCNDVNEMMELKRTMLDVLGREGRRIEF